jgi:gamma-glutamylputrescine oxidase
VPGYGHRYWAERTPKSRRPSRPSFRGQHSADVVVIGGGLTGCTAAWVLAAGGLSVILIEADRLASGATAGSLGAIVPQPDAAFLPVELAAGLRTARTAWKEARRSALDFVSGLSRLRIKCDLAPAPLVINAPGPDEGVLLRREQGARKAAGLAAPWMTPAAAGRATGTASAGAVQLHEAHVFDPVRAALGFAAAAESKGARIFERSTVRRGVARSRQHPHEGRVRRDGCTGRAVRTAPAARSSFRRPCRRHRTALRRDAPRSR